MKNFIVFIGALFFLIASEYYFLTEIFTRKRLPVIAGSLVGLLLCIFVFLRFFKNDIVSSSPRQA